MTGYIVAATLIALLALSLDVEAELAVHRAVRARMRVALGGVGLTLHIELRRQDGGLVVAIRRAGGGREHVRALGGGGGAPEQLKPALRTGARRLMRDVRVERLGLSARLGAGDAAMSALLCGVVGILASGLCAVANVRPELDVQPDFELVEFSMDVRGMFSARIGHIIGAGLAGIAEYFKGAFDRWKTQLALTRSRA